MNEWAAIGWACMDSHYLATTISTADTDKCSLQHSQQGCNITVLLSVQSAGLLLLIRYRS